MDADLLDGLDRRVEQGLRDLECDVGGVDAVEQPLLLVGAASGHGDARPDHVARDVDRASDQPEQLPDPSSIERHVHDGPVFDELARRRRFGLEQRGRARNFDRLRELAVLEREVQAAGADELEDDAGARQGLEPRGLGVHAIAAGLHERERVLALVVGRRRRGDARVLVG